MNKKPLNLLILLMLSALVLAFLPFCDDDEEEATTCDRLTAAGVDTLTAATQNSSADDIMLNTVYILPAEEYTDSTTGEPGGANLGYAAYTPDVTGTYTIYSEESINLENTTDLDAENHPTDVDIGEGTMVDCTSDTYLMYTAELTAGKRYVIQIADFTTTITESRILITM